jgi:hypothetical protein
MMLGNGHDWVVLDRHPGQVGKRMQCARCNQSSVAMGAEEPCPAGGCLADGDICLTHGCEASAHCEAAGCPHCGGRA